MASMFMQNYAVYWLRPYRTAWSLARKCNRLASIMVMRSVMRHARLQKLQRFRLKMPSIHFLFNADIMRKPNSIIVLLCIQNQETKNNANEHAKISCQVNSYKCSLDSSRFLKQSNDSNQSFKLMNINISSTTCRSAL